MQYPKTSSFEEKKLMYTLARRQQCDYFKSDLTSVRSCQTMFSPFLSNLWSDQMKSSQVIRKNFWRYFISSPRICMQVMRKCRWRKLPVSAVSNSVSFGERSGLPRYIYFPSWSDVTRPNCSTYFPVDATLTDNLNLALSCVKLT